MPQIAVANLTADHTTGTATSATTASVSPTANGLQLLSINAYVSTGSAQPPTPTITGLGITWQLEVTSDLDTSGSDRQTIFLFSGHSAAPSAGTVTIDFGATSIARMDWLLDEAVADDGGTSSVLQSATAAFASGATSGSVALASFANAIDNVAYAVFGVQKSNTGTTIFAADTGTGFAIAGEDQGSGCSAATGAEWLLGEPPFSCDMSWTASGTTLFRSAGLAVELEAAGDGGGAGGSPTAKMLATLGVG